MLADYLPYILVLWRGIFRQPKLDHLVLCVCESVERVIQFSKGVGKVGSKSFLIKIQFPKAILSENFGMFESLKRGTVYVLQFKKYISLRGFFCKF